MIRLAYIASPSYSGSTLLTRLLNAHPRIATIGELKWGDIDLESYACSCGALLRECGFWNEVSRRVQSRGLPFDLNRPPTDFRCRASPIADRVLRARVRGGAFESLRSGLASLLPARRKEWPTVRAVNRAIVEAVLELKRADVFLDASKDPVRLKHLLDSGDYDVWLIQLIRDGRGVVNSAIKNQSEPAELAAREWRRTHEQIQRLASRIGQTRVLRLRYEDLCEDPATALAQTYGFLGLPPCDAVSTNGSVPHHILGNRMRLVPNIEIRPDEKWRRELPPAACDRFERIAGRLNRHFGYSTA